MDVSRVGVSRVGGRRLVVVLGGLYVATVASYPYLPFAGDVSTELWVVLAILVGVPGLTLLYGGYRLPGTEVRPELYPTVGTWCLRGVAVGLVIVGVIAVASSDTRTIPNALLLTALGSFAGFGAGMYDARAKTRHLQLQETIDELEASNERLERHRRYTDDVLDAIDDVFYVLDESGSVTRWNESLSEVTGYSDAEIDSMSAADFFAGDDRDATADAVREGFEQDSVHVELSLCTSDGESIPFEFFASTLEAPSGETVLAGIGRDVTARVEREKRLEELVDRLEASNDRLEQFAHAASHDLQEPLRMVSSYLQLLESRYRDELDEDAQDYIDFAVDGADRMRAMIDGLLEYSRVDTDGDAFEPVDLDDVLADVRNDLRVRIDETDADVEAEPLPTVDGDPGQLRQVFQNLLDNAVEYSGDESPRVRISAERDGDAWSIAVRDEGIGIDSDDADRVFDVFESFHSTDEHPGTGIGLALCERIVERHGGEIRVESTPGEGSTFMVALPVEGTHDE